MYISIYGPFQERSLIDGFDNKILYFSIYTTNTAERAEFIQDDSGPERA